MNENFKEIGVRFKKYLRHKDLGTNQAASILGFSGSQVSNITNGRKFGTDKAFIILNTFNDLDSEWLFRGNGNMIKKEHGVQKIESLTDSPGINYQKKGVPYFDVDFIGGFDLVIQDQTVNPSFYIDFEPFNDADYWVNVTGKSMSPFISHGDIIALQVYNNWERFLLGGEIYAIITEDFRTVKILQDGQDKDHFALIPYSKDPNFKTQQLPKELVKQVFKVKGAIKKFF